MRSSSIVVFVCFVLLLGCGKKSLTPSPDVDVQQLLEIEIRDAHFEKEPLEAVVWKIADETNVDFVIITPLTAFDSVTLANKSIIARDLLDQATKAAGAVWQIERNLLVIGRESDLGRIRQLRDDPIAPLPASNVEEELAAIREQHKDVKVDAAAARLRSKLPLMDDPADKVRALAMLAEMQQAAQPYGNALTAPPLPPPEEFQQQLLTVVDLVEARDSTLHQIAEDLRSKHAALNLVLVDSLNDAPSARTLNLRLRGRSMDLALQYLAEASRAGVRRDDRAIVIGDERRLRLVRNSTRQSLPLRLHVKLLDSFSTRDASLTEFLDDLFWEDDATRPARTPALQIAVRGELSPLKIDLQLQKIPLADIIQYAAEQANCGMMRELQTVWLLPPGAPVSHHEMDMIGRN